MKKMGLVIFLFLSLALMAEETNEVADVVRSKASIQTRLFKLTHASAAEVAERFNTMWSGEFGQVWKVSKMAVPFDESNTVMVTAPEPILRACERVIGELDVETPQVYIEARFVELGNTASHKVGIDWQMLSGMRGTVNLGGGIKGLRLGDNVIDYRTTNGGSEYDNYTYNVNGDNGDLTYFTGTLDFSQMSIVLSALDSTHDTKTFSNPKIIVSSGKRARVDMTTKYPNVAISAKRTSIGGSDYSLDLSMNMSEIPGEDKRMFAKESFFSWGIELEVLPRVSTNGFINVSIIPTISAQSDWVTAGGGVSGSGETSGEYTSKYPVIDVKRLITEFSMKSGQTAVIGGLSKTEEIQVDTGIPVLREIPWIGPRLFGSMSREKVQREIIVFVTVGLVDPKKVSADAGLPKNAVLGRQYIKGQKLEPGDRPEKNMEGVDSLDTRLLDEQAKDPLNQASLKEFNFGDYIPFTANSNNKPIQEKKK